MDLKLELVSCLGLSFSEVRNQGLNFGYECVLDLDSSVCRLIECSYEVWI